jgi:hypothetical protein
MAKIHKFPDKVKLVINDRSMAFIALDESSVKSGINWAKSWRNRDYEPEILEYENGHFTFHLYKPADDSSQNGKLSFWILKMTCPDGKVFDVGINSTTLNQALLECDSIMGQLRGEFYIGRTDAQQSIAAKNGKLYKDYLNQVEVKKTPLNDKYVVGDKIKNGREEYIYLGQGKKILNYDYRNRRYDGKSPLIYNSIDPEDLYFYISMWGSYVISRDKKMNGRLIDHTDETLDTYIGASGKAVTYNIYDYINLNTITDITEINKLLEGTNYVITDVK